MMTDVSRADPESLVCLSAELFVATVALQRRWARQPGYERAHWEAACDVLARRRALLAAVDALLRAGDDLESLAQARVRAVAAGKLRAGEGVERDG